MLRPSDHPLKKKSTESSWWSLVIGSGSSPSPSNLIQNLNHRTWRVGWDVTHPWPSQSTELRERGPGVFQTVLWENTHTLAECYSRLISWAVCVGDSVTHCLALQHLGFFCFICAPLQLAKQVLELSNHYHSSVTGWFIAPKKAKEVLYLAEHHYSVLCQPFGCHFAFHLVDKI